MTDAPAHWRISDAIWGFLIGLLATIVAVIFLGEDLTNFEILAIAIPMEQAATIGFLAWRAGGWTELRQRVALRFEATDGKWVAAGLGVQIAVALLITLPLVRLFDDPDTQQSIGELVSNAGGLREKVASFVVIVLAAPLVEEILYRGVLFSALRQRVSGVVALHGQAAVFAVVHLLDPSAIFAVPGLYVAGLALGWVVRRTGRLGPAVAMHAGFNLLGWVALLAL